MRSDGSSSEERLRTGRRYRTDRTEGISDGVFAVSLTLLILDVRPPEGGVSQLVHGVVLIAPRLGTFALSFAIVAYYWLRCSVLLNRYQIGTTAPPLLTHWRGIRAKRADNLGGIAEIEYRRGRSRQL